MRKNTLVYGLGKDYFDNEDWIHKHYEVTGCCDQDNSRLLQGTGIPKKCLKERIHEFETILIAADPVSIIADLVDVFHVPLEKIAVLFYEMDKDSQAKIRFYGNDNEDAALLLLFQQMGYTKKDVKYVEIGTNDPVRFNNTFNFYKRNTGGGILVDPLPAVGYLSQLIRPRDRFIHAGVSEYSAENVPFFACKSSTVSSLYEKHHHHWDGQSHNSIQQIQVELIGVNDLLEQAGDVLDFLLIDAEGEDEKIIHAINYERYHPKVIMVEFDHMEESKEDLVRFMCNKGYVEFTTIKQNIIFVATKF